MNKYNKIRIRFLKYWRLINLCKFKVDDRTFEEKTFETGHKSDNFYDIEKPVRILRDNLITKNWAKFLVDWMKIVCLILSADLEDTVLRQTRHSRHFEKEWPKIFLTHFKARFNT